MKRLFAHICDAKGSYRSLELLYSTSLDYPGSKRVTSRNITDPEVLQFANKLFRQTNITEPSVLADNGSCYQVTLWDTQKGTESETVSAANIDHLVLDQMLAYNGTEGMAEAHIKDFLHKLYNARCSVYSDGTPCEFILSWHEENAPADTHCTINSTIALENALIMALA